MKLILSLFLLITQISYSQKEYVSRVENPICSDFCSLTLTDITDKVVFFRELPNIVIYSDEGEVINPVYQNTYFSIQTETITSEDDNGEYKIEVITSIKMKN